MMLYDVALSHPYINTEAEARGRIEDLASTPDDFCFMELDDEEEWDDDDFDEDELDDEDRSSAERRREERGQRAEGAMNATLCASA